MANDNDVMWVFGYYPGKTESGWLYSPGDDPQFTRTYCEEMEELGWPDGVVIWWAEDLEELIAYMSEGDIPENAAFMWRVTLFDLGLGSDPYRKTWDEGAHQRAEESGVRERSW